MSEALAAQRVSDADREAVAVALREHFGAGRIDDDELDERVARAYAARTRGDLDALMTDLPALGGPPAAPGPGRPARRRRREVTRAGRGLRISARIHLSVYVLVNALLVAIWALTGGGAFWPIWSLLGWGVGLGAHWSPILAGVGTRRTDSEAIDALAAAATRDRPSLKAATAPDGTVTILFSDIVDSTVLNDRLGDARWLELLRAHHEIVREQIDAHGGFEVKEQGDGFMVAFPSARRGVGCARALQAAVAERLGAHPDGPVRVRVGLHTGEAVRTDEDFYGRNVVLAARVAAVAEPGEVLVSAVVRDQLGPDRFGPGREVELKGLGTETVYPAVAS